jgi:hypothetical protein
MSEKEFNVVKKNTQTISVLARKIKQEIVLQVVMNKRQNSI